MKKNKTVLKVQYKYMLTVFKFKDHDVRFVDGKPVANDVADVLGYASPKDAIYRHVSEKNKGGADLTTPGGIQKVIVLEEAGVYQLIFKSKLEKAEEFQDWVFEEVLPSIRKTGSYSIKPLTTEQMFLQNAQILIEHSNRLVSLEQSQEQQLALLNQTVEQLQETVKELEEQKLLNEVQDMEIKANSVELDRFSNGQGYWYTILGYAKLQGLEISLTEASRLGRLASAMCRQLDIPTQQVTDPRFGTVNTYPQHVLSEVM